MPFKSEKQRRYMWMEHPKIAQKWADEEKGNRLGKALKGKRKKKK